MKEVAVNEIVRLLLAEQDGDISASEQAVLDAWKAAIKENQAFYDRCQDEVKVSQSLTTMSKYNADDGWRQFSAREGIQQVRVIPVRRRSWYWLMAAATLVVLTTALVTWLGRRENTVAQPVAFVNKGENIIPGVNKATLTLSDGRTIVLEDQQNGIMTQDQGVALRKKGDIVEYEHENKSGGDKERGEAVAYNTARTARGSFIAITLPDNSKVWLNADASLRFPVRFSGDERRVELTGEAYFEVAKQPEKPFIVVASGAEVRVLGTHFNVRSYGEEETVKATLLEGKVEIGTPGNGSKTVLKPGQQATIVENSAGLKVQSVEVDPVIAWKNGLFDFQSTPLVDILKEVKRWYPDIESIEMPKLIDERFSATVSRSMPLSKLLEILEATNRVHFEVKSKVIYVTE